MSFNYPLISLFVAIKIYTRNSRWHQAKVVGGPRPKALPAFFFSMLSVLDPIANRKRILFFSPQIGKSTQFLSAAGGRGQRAQRSRGCDRARGVPTFLIGNGEPHKSMTGGSQVELLSLGPLRGARGESRTGWEQRSARPIRPAAGRAARGPQALADHTSWRQREGFGWRFNARGETE